MATHSSVLAWRIPGMGEPGGLPSMGSHKVGHDWSDLAAAAAAGWWSEAGKHLHVAQFTLKPSLLAFWEARKQGRETNYSLWSARALLTRTVFPAVTWSHAPGFLEPEWLSLVSSRLAAMPDPTCDIVWTAGRSVPPGFALWSRTVAQADHSSFISFLAFSRTLRACHLKSETCQH